MYWDAKWIGFGKQLSEVLSELDGFELKVYWLVIAFEKWVEYVELFLFLKREHLGKNQRSSWDGFNSSIYSANKNGCHASWEPWCSELLYFWSYKYSVKSYLGKNPPAVPHSSKTGQDKCLRVPLLAECEEARSHCILRVRCNVGWCGIWEWGNTYISARKI